MQRLHRGVLRVALPVFVYVFSFGADSASELSYLAGVSVGIKETAFDLTSTAGPTFFVLNEGQGPIIPATQGGSLSFDFEEPLYTAGFSGAMVYEQLTLSALIEIPIQKADTTLSTNIVSEPGLGVPVPEVGARDTELDRFDVSLTLGYKVWKGLSVFSGYKYTEFDLLSREDNFILNEKDQHYEEEGLFLGTSYAWQLGSAGSLSISIAYAYLDATFSEGNVADAPPPFGQTFGEFSYSGSANGLSYGAQWSGRLADRWLYSVALKHQSYTSEDNATTLQPYFGDYFLSQDPDVPIPVQATPISISNIDTEHSDTTFSIGLIYPFR